MGFQYFALSPLLQEMNVCTKNKPVGVGWWHCGQPKVSRIVDIRQWPLADAASVVVVVALVNSQGLVNGSSRSASLLEESLISGAVMGMFVE